MDISENPESSQDFEEKRSPEPEDSAGLDFILDDGELVADVPIHKPYVPAMENNEPPIHTAEGNGKWEKPSAIPSPQADENVPPVQVPPAPPQSIKPPPMPGANIQPSAKPQQYIPGMEEVQSDDQASTAKQSKKSRSRLSLLTIVVGLLILAGGGYLGYLGYNKYVKKAEPKGSSEDGIAQKIREGQGKIRITKAELGESIKIAKAKIKAENTKIKPFKPKSTAQQVQEARGDIMGLFDRAKAVVAQQNARLQETVENIDRQKANGARRKSAKPALAVAIDENSAADNEAAETVGENAGSESALAESVDSSEALTYGQAPEGFKLTGTMNMDGKRVAFINQTVVRVGKVINDATVVEIGHRWVELKTDNLLFRLNMD